MANFGKTIFQRRQEQSALNDQTSRQRLVEDRQFNLRQEDLALRQITAANDAEKSDFWKRLQMAQLMGKASMAVPGYQPKAQDPALQEGIDLGKAAGQYEMDLTRAKQEWRAPWQEAIGGRDALNREARVANNETVHLDKLMGFDVRQNMQEDQQDFLRQQWMLNRNAQRQNEITRAGTWGPFNVRQMNTMRDDLHKDKSYVNAQKADIHYNTVMTAAPGGMGDISLIVAYNYLLEPDSIVTAGEFQRNQFAVPLTQKVEIAWNNLAKGGMAAEQQRAQIRQEGAKLHAERLAQYQAKKQEYENIARGMGYDPRGLAGGMISDGPSWEE